MTIYGIWVEEWTGSTYSVCDVFLFESEEERNKRLNYLLDTPAAKRADYIYTGFDRETED